MTLEDLEFELGGQLVTRCDGKLVVFKMDSFIEHGKYNKEAIVLALRQIRERMLLRIDDLICWAREEDK